MYTAKIPGTRYITSLDSLHGRWYLRLRLSDVIEAEVEVPQMNKRAIHTSLGNLFLQMNLQINTFQHDLIHKELVAQIAHLLSQEHDPEENLAKYGEDAKEDPRVDELIGKLDDLETHLQTLEERIDRIEALNSN